MADFTTVLIQDTIASPTIVDAINANDEKALKALYVNNFHKIESLVLKNNGTTEEAKDVYQEAFITVWKNVRNNKFHPKNETAINGYLYTIAKNKWMDHLRSPEFKKRGAYDTANTAGSVHSDEESKGDNIIYEKNLALALEAFEELGEACKSLLTKFYFEKKTIKEIAEELQMNAASTRNKKYRCMQVLRELAFEINIKSESE